MVYIVGLTGGIGSGKTTVSNLFKELNVPVVDADEISREIVKPNKPAYLKIIKYFGNDIINTDQTLNRKKLREIIFNSDEKRLWLNNLLHPIIEQQTWDIINKCTFPYIIWSVPLLIENSLNKFCDRILVIDVDEEIQLQRAIARDKNKIELIKSIIAKQISRQDRLSYADDVIVNNLPLTENKANLIDQVHQLHKKYLTLAKLKN